MKNKDYEPNIIEFFVKTLNKKIGTHFSFKKSDNPIDDGYVVSTMEKDIPVQLVDATDGNLKKIIIGEVNKKGVSTYTPLPSIPFIEQAIKLKSNKRYAHSKELILLIHPSECDDWVEDGLRYLQSIPEIENFKSVYVFYPGTKPKLVAIKGL